MSKQISDDIEFPIATFLIHQGIAIIAPTLGFLILDRVFGPLFVGIAQPFGCALLSLVYLIVGSAIGYAVHKLTKINPGAGKFVCVLPLTVFLTGFVHDAVECSLKHALEEMFFPDFGPGNWAALAALLITLPTWGAVCYSAGIWYASMARTDPTQPRNAEE